jgi:hypothetical protein
MARSTDDDRERLIEQIMLDYIDQERGAGHGDRRQDAFGRLMDLGISDVQALMLLDDPIGTLQWARRSGAEGTPMAPQGPSPTSPEVDSPYPSQMDEIFESTVEKAGFRSSSKPAPEEDDDGDGNEFTIPPEFAVLRQEDQAAWLEENGGSLPPEQLETIRVWLSQGNGSGEAREAIDNLVESEGTGTESRDVEQHEEVEAEEADAREIIEAEIQQWRDRNGTAAVPTLMLEQAVRDAGISDPERVVAQVKEEMAGELAEDEEEPDDAEERLFTDIQLPEWVLQKALQLNGGVPLSPEQEMRLVEYVNLYKGGDYEDVGGIVGVLGDPSKENQLLVEAAVLDDAPDAGWTVQVPGGRNMVISGTQAANLFENYGFNMTGLNRMARLVAMTGESVLPYDDPADNLLLVASLMSGFGAHGEFSNAEERGLGEPDDGRRINQQDPRRPGGFFRDMEGMDEDVAHPIDAAQTISRMPVEQGIEWVRSNWQRMHIRSRQSVQKYIQSLPAGSPERTTWQLARAEGFGIGTTNPRHPSFQSGGRRPVGRLIRDPHTGEIMSDVTSQEGVQHVMDRYKRGFERYNDIGLAMVHSIDVGLAARIAQTGGDPSKLSVEDEARTWAIIRRTSGEQAESWLDLAPESPLALFRSFSSDRMGSGGGGGGGGAGRIVPKLDKDAVKQQFAQMMSALLLVDPDEDMMNNFADGLQRQLAAAEEGQQFDVSAKIQDFVRGQAKYQELYKNKPAGMDEGQYMGMFRGAESDLLGNEAASNESIEAGLRTGQYQSTVGSIAFDKDRTQQNSRFQERLIEASNVFQRNT